MDNKVELSKFMGDYYSFELNLNDHLKSMGTKKEDFNLNLFQTYISYKLYQEIKKLNLNLEK